MEGELVSGSEEAIGDEWKELIIGYNICWNPKLAREDFDTPFKVRRFVVWYCTCSSPDKGYSVPQGHFPKHDMSTNPTSAPQQLYSPSVESSPSSPPL